MKPLKLIANALLLAVFSIGMLTAQNDNSVLMTMNEITVKYGHNAQFIEGAKKWKDCYLENNGENRWDMWKRVQGEGNVYVMTGLKANWAEIGQSDSVNKDCYAIFMNFIMPHVEKVNFNIARSMPDVSRSFPEDTKLAWVYFFKVNNSPVFRENITAVVGTVKAKEGAFRSAWYSYAGGAPEAADYMVSVPFKGYADLDISRDNIWKIYEEAHGKEKTDEMRASQREVIDVSWSYLYELKSELSN